MGNRSENTRSRVLHPILYLTFQNFRKRISKLIVFKLIVDKKLKLLQGINCI